MFTAVSICATNVERMRADKGFHLPLFVIVDHHGMAREAVVGDGFDSNDMCMSMQSFCA